MKVEEIAESALINLTIVRSVFFDVIRVRPLRFFFNIQSVYLNHLCILYAVALDKFRNFNF